MDGKLVKQHSREGHRLKVAQRERAIGPVGEKQAARPCPRYALTELVTWMQKASEVVGQTIGALARQGAQDGLVVHRVRRQVIRLNEALQAAPGREHQIANVVGYAKPPPPRFKLVCNVSPMSTHRLPPGGY